MANELTPVHVAAGLGDVERVRELLADGADPAPYWRRSVGRRPLWACQGGQELPAGGGHCVPLLVLTPVL
jgi:hypothetical protein